jgi:putative serine/threonine protein kinase
VVKQPLIIPIDQLMQQPYASLLCFPNPSETELQSRLQELRNLGVTALEFSGKASVFGVGVPVLGKGFVGIVAIAHVNGQRIAVKIRRADADRADLLHEAEMLAKANSVNVAPKIVASSKNFLLMQLVDGGLFVDWLKNQRDRAVVREVLVDVLEQCWRLDEAGLDHGELSKAPKHLLLDKAGKPFIVDFETASVERRAINVTSICQFLFMGNSSAAQMLGGVFGERNRPELTAALKAYKKGGNRGNFEAIIRVAFA